jgi:hypothetical protein
MIPLTYAYDIPSTFVLKPTFLLLLRIGSSKKGNVKLRGSYTGLCMPDF